MNYLVIPFIRSQAANIHNASFLIGGPPVLAAYFFAHALSRRLNFMASGVGLVHHHAEPKGERAWGIFYPQQRKSAAFTFGPNRGRDYSSKNKHALSLQPVATADICATIIVECEGLRSIEGVDRFLHSARFSGGAVTSSGKPVTFATLEDALDTVNSGFAVIDRRDILERRGAQDSAELFVEALGAVPRKEGVSTWLSATCLGYAAISSFDDRVGVREGYLHAFAEPMIGLVQYRSIRECRTLASSLLWQGEWVKSDVFRVFQQQS